MPTGGDLIKSLNKVLTVIHLMDSMVFGIKTETLSPALSKLMKKRA